MTHRDRENRDITGAIALEGIGVLKGEAERKKDNRNNKAKSRMFLPILFILWRVIATKYSLTLHIFTHWAPLYQMTHFQGVLLFLFRNSLRMMPQLPLASPFIHSCAL